MRRERGLSACFTETSMVDSLSRESSKFRSGVAESYVDKITGSSFVCKSAYYGGCKLAENILSRDLCVPVMWHASMCET